VGQRPCQLPHFVWLAAPPPDNKTAPGAEVQPEAQPEAKETEQK